VKRFLVYLLPVAILALFIFVMNSNIYLQRNRSKDNNFPMYIEKVKEDIRNNRWNEAKINIEKLENSWNLIMPKLQFSVERDEIGDLNASLARLKGAITAEDKGEALADLNEAQEHWNRLDD